MGESLERPQAPARHRLDVDAYYKMAEAGILTRDDRVELIDGEIIDLNPIGSPHAGNRRIDSARLFAKAAADGHVLIERPEPASPRCLQRTRTRSDAAAAPRRRLSGESPRRRRRASPH